MVNKSNNRIIWPKNNFEALKKFIEFQLIILEEFQIEFDSEPSPICIAKKFINNKISEKEYSSYSIKWWNFIDANNSISEFQNIEILKARLAICLLSVSINDVSELDEHLSWFLQVLKYYGLDIDKVKRTLNDCF